MRSIKSISLLAAAAGTLASVILATTALGEPLGTAFTYQGELRALPANTVVTGTATVKFRLYDAVSGGNRLGLNGVPNATFELVRANVVLTDGKFTVSDLDFGAAFDANAKYLEILVTVPGQPEVTLSPRQRVGTGPAASYAASAANAASATNATNLAGVAATSYSRLDTSQTYQGTKTFAVPPAFSNLAGAPFTVQSTATVANLSADLLDGYHAAAFGRLAAAQSWAAINTFNVDTIIGGRLGVGSLTGPTNPLDVTVGTRKFSVRADGPVPGINLSGPNDGLSGILRLRNRLEVMPDDTNARAAQVALYNPTLQTILLDSTLGAGDFNGAVRVGNSNAGTDTFQNGDNGLRFGSGLTGEGISSNRSGAGANQWGMDFYTGPGGSKRMSLTNDGKLGLGTDAPFTTLHVVGTGSYGGNHIALFENTSSLNGDGIAIKIDQAHTNRDNNFVTFYNGSSAVVGRIEGFDLENGDWSVPPPSLNTPTFNVDPAITLRSSALWFSPGTLPSASFSPGTLPSYSNSTVHLGNPFNVDVITGTTFNSGTSPSFTFNTGTLPLITGSPFNFGTPSFSVTNLPTAAQLQDLYCWYNTNGMANILTFDPVGLATRNMWITAAQLCRDEGVTYGSKGADYAEWLPRADEHEDIRWGMVVGVKGGKISKSTDGADQVMVVSRAPIVLGNTPPAGQEARYEKVGFMGQVHTLVRGIACVGDYILPSGLGDGAAIAVAPDKITPDQIGRVIGRAWSASTGPMDFVNVAVGMNGGEVASVVSRQQARVDVLASENASLRADVDALKAQCAAMQEAIRALQPDAVPARRATPLHVR